MNDAPVTWDQSFNINEDSKGTIAFSGSDQDGDILSAVIWTLPSVGSLYYFENATALISSVPAYLPGLKVGGRVQSQ